MGRVAPKEDGEPITLTEVCVRPRSHSASARGLHVVPVPQALATQIRELAARLEVTEPAVYVTAAAIVQDQLTGSALQEATFADERGEVRRIVVRVDVDSPGRCVAQVCEALRTAGVVRDEAPALAWRIDSRGGASLHASYDSQVYDPALVARLAGFVLAVAEALSRGAAGRGAFSLLSNPERDRLLALSACPGKSFAPSDTVHSMFAAQAAASPESTAIEAGERRWTYAALDMRSLRVSAALIAAGAARGERIGLALERSPEAIAAILGILRAGCVYVPIDTALPGERVRFMLADADIRYVIASSDTAVSARHVLDIAELLAFERVAAPAQSLVDAQAGAYVMYTSGSTGTPKGVEIRHESILRLVRGVSYVRLEHGRGMLHAAPIGFDASTLEIWGPLLNGGRCIIHAERVPTTSGLQRTLREHDVRTAWLTASLFNVLVDQDVGCLAGLDQLLIGGEALSVPHVKRALAALPTLALINGYGPTECTTFTTTYSIPRTLDADLTAIPIGKPIENTRCHVLNARGDLVPQGFVGELHVGGPGVARGYLQRPELTAERFVPDAVLGGQDLLYRTGDLVRQLPGGVMEYFGRRDGQVKLRGFRIETGEVEIALARVAGVRSCAVVARRDGDAAESQLVAYIVAARPLLQASAVREALAAELPKFMVPGAYVFLESLPVTPNGKLDRRALPAPARLRPETGEPYAAPASVQERALCSIYAQVLDLDRVGRTDNFFELGGSSLAAVRLAARITAALQVELTLPTIFQHPTPATLALAIERGRGDAIPLERLPRRGANADSSHAPIAIVAVAGRFPGAADVDAFWSNLVAGREGLRTFSVDELDRSLDPALVADSNYVRRRGVLDGVDQFDAAFFGITPKEAELMDPQQRVFLELCWECLERGGHTPDGVQGPIGVFAGMYNASYFQQHIAAHPDKVEQLGAFLVMLANEKDYIATRVAHKLDLTGPAVSVHTACSTSLVAIAQAVASLRAGQCDLALAGGSSIVCPPNSGYLYQEGAMLSPDGHTRTFDSHAAGTTFSDGAAVLLLKRADDALRDGDHVIALIRGVAINNDGGRKASFTAPSVDGQAAVIATALDDAGVDAASISYVEAHGTATPIGDPIEIEGLTKAFRRHTDQVGFCAIGSVKSNVGHLVIAAGAAGVIKTALALHHERIPPNANYQSSNPAIPFATSPFHVADRLIEWPRSRTPRRAGVSSFGVGGTNAHVVLEEAPLPAARAAVDTPQLIVLSARSETALDAAIANLSRHFEAHPATNLADAAHTLRVGRKPFAHRAFAVAASTAEAATLLAAADRTRVPRRKLGNGSGVVFMFPGQGAQYAGMGSALHAQDPVFRDAFAAVCEAVRGELADLEQLMFHGDAQRLAQTSVTQPATFAIEYALARLWLARGVEPQALIGHSVGEFVAAVLAGVMSLADAARLVARRGRLMQAQASGAMLSIRAGADKVAALLPVELSLAASNGPHASVVAGTHEAVAAFQRELESQGLPARLLQTSHAFHSAMMDPAVAPFAAAVREVHLAPPAIPIISTLTGERLTDDQAIDPRYWARHLRETVRFSPAVRTAAADSPAVLLEIGPRTTLATLARQHFAPGTASPNCVASLGDAPENEIASLLAAHGQLWISGVTAPSHRLSGPDCRRVPLPTYPFERRRHWLDARPHVAAPAAVQAAPAMTPIHVPVAMESSMPAPSPAAQADRVPHLIGRLRGVFEDVAGIDMGEADASMAFVELGLDSLSLTQVALQLQKTFGVKIAFRQLMESYSSLDLLAKFLDTQMPADAAPVTATAVPQGPAMQPMAFAPVDARAVSSTAPFMQQVIQQQMQIMAQQLALLGGASAANVPLAVTAAPGTQAGQTVAAPAAPAAPTAPPASAVAAEEPAGMIKYDVQKAFGAIARIHTKGSQEVTDRQRARLDAFMRRYIARTRKSKDYTQEHRAHLADPRVVNGFRPQLKEMIYQIVIERSQGPYVWDLDGNKYVDALNGFGMNLFGWQPQFVLDAVRKQLDAGYEIGPQHPLAGDVARKVCAMTGFDRAGLCNTGSEAVMGAIRIARTVTGRSRIALFTGAYHGIFDEVIVRATRKQKAYPAAPGIMPNTAENVLVLDYGTPESLEILKANAPDLAAVLIEPVQSRRPDFQPREFLREVRALTQASGALCIFDEVVTGFRSHPRGAQAVLGIDADLASYGKVVGGGFPIGIIAGKREYMDALDGGHWQFGDDSIPTVGPTYFAGTFVRHPLALAAANAVLDHLQQHGAELQSALNARTSAMVQEINTFLESVGAPITVKSFSSVWKTFFDEDHPLQDLLFAMMRSRGIHILDNFPCFMTTAHSAEDIAAMVNAFKESVIELQEADFIPRRKPAASPVFDAARPPVPGARLGRDADGKPAWFAPNPDAPGKFLKVS